MHALVSFIYIDELPSSFEKDVASLGELLKAADKYNIGLLKQVVEEELLIAPSNDEVPQLLSWAKASNSSVLEKAGSQFLKDNLLEISKTQEFVELMQRHPDALLEKDDNEERNDADDKNENNDELLPEHVKFFLNNCAKRAFRSSDSS